MDTTREPKSFRDVFLRHRRQTGLIQRDLAARVGVSVQTVQAWEGGLKLPAAARLQQLIRAFLEAGGFAPGRERSEARELWTAVEREASRMHTAFDEGWFAGLLAARALAPPQSVTDELERVGALGPAGTAAPQDWGEAPDSTGFVGRAEELALLRRWLLDEHCRLVGVLGFGGIGKTALAARSAQRMAASFERVYWRTLHDARVVSEWLAGAIAFLSDRQLAPPASESEGINALLQILRTTRCLLVLDNFETLFEPRQPQRPYRTGMDGYGRLLQAVGETTHQSCLLLISREAPPDLVVGGVVRGLELHGLGRVDTQALLSDKHLIGDMQAWGSLVHRYGGNGLAMKIVAETVRQVYDGDLAAFLEATANSGTVFGGIRHLIEAQLQRLTPAEREVLTRLAVEHVPIGLAELTRDLSPSVGRSAVIEAIETLRRRSLVERGERGATFALQSMVFEYVADRRGETAAEEVDPGLAPAAADQPLAGPQANEQPRKTEERLVATPTLQPGQRTSPPGRDSECAVLDALVAGIRRGQSRSLVLWGQPGIGKTALLEYMVESATDLTIARAAGIDSEMELAFASLHQLCGPMLDRLDKLPAPQRQSLETVFGLSAGPAPDQFIVGLAVLSLFSEVARERPLLCVVDDAQWLDRASALTLAFVARRLQAEPIGIVFAARESGEELGHLSHIEVRGLLSGDAPALLGSAVRYELDEQARERIIAET